MYPDDMFDSLFYAIIKGISETGKQMYEEMNCEIDVIELDEDLLKIQIDEALDNRDEERFMILTERLRLIQNEAENTK